MTKKENEADSVGSKPISTSDKWPQERKALKKVQMHFNFVHDLHRKIHHEGANTDLAPSDVVRKIVGLSYVKIRRPRIGLSFDETDLKYLSERYGVDMSDKAEIKRRVMEETAESLREK